MRVAYVRLSWEFVLAAVCMKGQFDCRSFMPDDARVAYLELLPDRREVHVYFTSEHLPEVPEGDVIMEHVPALAILRMEPAA